MQLCEWRYDWPYRRYDAAIAAIECLDECLGRVTKALEKVGGEALITADHGNAELMFDENWPTAYCAHSNLVPLIYVGKRHVELAENDALCNIAPALLNY